MKQTSLEEFVDLASPGTFVPVCKEIMADLLTPVSAFLKIAEHSDNAFLLESVDGGEQVARYSFLGKDPFLIVRSRKGQTIVEHAGVISKQPESFMSYRGLLVVQLVILATIRSHGLKHHCRKLGLARVLWIMNPMATMKQPSCSLTRCSLSIMLHIAF